MKKYTILVAAYSIIALLQLSFVNDEPADKAALGKLLFLDPILSKDSTISCASCHKPAYAFADTSAGSFGVDSSKGKRNTPSAMNLTLQKIMFWDGRAKDLEAQAIMPIENPDEMNLPLSEAVRRLGQNEKYSTYFQKIFGSKPTKENLAQAIAAFERTLETSESPYDEWKYSGNDAMITDAAKRGFTIFNTKGKCIKCHFGSNLNLDEFRNIGLFNGKYLNDSGRLAVSGKAEDIGKFKVPSLRNVAVTGPYMHNGIFRTLREVIEFYNDPAKVVPVAINRDSILSTPLGLKTSEINDLEEFLISLTDKAYTITNR